MSGFWMFTVYTISFWNGLWGYDCHAKKFAIKVEVSEWYNNVPGIPVMNLIEISVGYSEAVHSDPLYIVLNL